MEIMVAMRLLLASRLLVTTHLLVAMALLVSVVLLVTMTVSNQHFQAPGHLLAPSMGPLGAPGQPATRRQVEVGQPRAGSQKDTGGKVPSRDGHILMVSPRGDYHLMVVITLWCHLMVAIALWWPPHGVTSRWRSPYGSHGATSQPQPYPKPSPESFSSDLGAGQVKGPQWGVVAEGGHGLGQVSGLEVASGQVQLLQTPAPLAGQPSAALGQPRDALGAAGQPQVEPLQLCGDTTGGTRAAQGQHTANEPRSDQDKTQPNEQDMAKHRQGQDVTKEPRHKQKGKMLPRDRTNKDRPRLG